MFHQQELDPRWDRLINRSRMLLDLNGTVSATALEVPEQCRNGKRAAAEEGNRHEPCGDKVHELVEEIRIRDPVDGCVNGEEGEEGLG